MNSEYCEMRVCVIIASVEHDYITRTVGTDHEYSVTIVNLLYSLRIPVDLIE